MSWRTQLPHRVPRVASSLTRPRAAHADGARSAAAAASWQMASSIWRPVIPAGKARRRRARRALDDRLGTVAVGGTD
jgi:hypothetical protein